MYQTEPGYNNRDVFLKLILINGPSFSFAQLCGGINYPLDYHFKTLKLLSQYH